jgi:hypothetical protein
MIHSVVGESEWKEREWRLKSARSESAKLFEAENGCEAFREGGSADDRRPAGWVRC